MNEIEKLLRKIRKKDRDLILMLMIQLDRDYTRVPGVKKIVGKPNLFRIRVGEYRIIFSILKGGIFYHKISKRDNNTYKNL